MTKSERVPLMGWDLSKIYSNCYQICNPKGFNFNSRWFLNSGLVLSVADMLLGMEYCVHKGTHRFGIT